jgi:hypothetical protein
VAGDARDVDGPSVLVPGDFALYDHRARVARVVVVVQVLDEGYAVAALVKIGTVVATAILDEGDEDSAA